MMRRTKQILRGSLENISYRTNAGAPTEAANGPSRKLDGLSRFTQQKTEMTDIMCFTWYIAGANGQPS
jgi:hypothetical protein